MEGGIGMEALGMEGSIGIQSDELPILKKTKLVYIEPLFLLL